MVKRTFDTKGQMDPRLIYLPGILGFLIYLLTIGHGFVLDDNLVITQNAHVQKGFSGIGELLTTNYAHGHLNFNDGLYRPLSLVTFAVEKSLFDLSPKASHFIQALLYGLLLIVLGKWLQSMLGEHAWSAFWVLLLFALHPIHTEVVANLKSRDEILALLFFAIAAWFWVKYLNSDKVVELSISLFSFLLALFSKESAITFLVVFPLIQYFHKNEKPIFYVRSILVFAVPAVIFLLTRAHVLSEMGAVDSGVTGILQNVLTTTDSWVERIATASVVQGMYIWKMLVPVNLSHDYSYNAIELQGLTSPWFWVSVLVVFIMIAEVIRSIRSREWHAFGILFYFITISVVANVVLLIGALAAERFVFTPSLGFIIGLVSLVYAIPALRPRSSWIFALLSVAFLILTVQRIPDWESNYTLFAADVDKVPNSARAHYNLGTASNDQAKVEPRERQKLRSDAERHLKEAIEIWPEYQDAYNNLGVVYLDQGRLEDAFNIYATTYERFPSYNKGLFNLAVTAYKLQRFAAAEEHFETYYDRTSQADALYMAAESEGYQSKFDEAIAHLNELVSLEPTKSRGHLKLGTAYGITGDPEKAEFHFNKAVELDPRNAETHLNLGIVYLNTSRPELARVELETALDLNPNLDQAQQLLRGL